MMRGSDGAIGSIIASPDNGNPSATAAHLLRQSCLGLEYGQILRPCILVGEEASRYSKQHNLWKPCRVVGDDRVESRFPKNDSTKERSINPS